MEGMVLNRLNFELSVATTKVFINRFLKAAKAGECDSTTEMLCKYLCELTLQEYNFIKYRPSEIAAAGLPMPAANQLELHPLTQKPELLVYMKEHKILPIAYSSLAPLSNWREGYQAIKGTKTDEEKKVTTVEVIAKRLGVSPARVLLRYALQRGWACIPKTTKEERLKENLDLEAFELSEADVKALDALEANANVTWDAPPGQHFDLTTLP